MDSTAARSIPRVPSAVSSMRVPAVAVIASFRGRPRRRVSQSSSMLENASFLPLSATSTVPTRIRDRFP